ncbi:MAG TPA: ROK family transcriptional regulator [Spirochaetia bacterium]|nr:ROK family transcriptional regulator [Spirochaetia bacterium]
MDQRNTDRRDFRVLQAVYFLPTPTRNEIARFTGRSPVSVTDTLKRLLDAGLVEKAGKTRSRSGRPSMTYQLGEKTGCSVGVSLDPSGFRVVALDSRHAVVQEVEKTLTLSASPASHLEEIMDQVTGQLRRFLAAMELKHQRTLSIGIAPPGMVDTEKGVWLHGLQVSGIAHVSLGAALQKMFSTPVVVEDAARCLAFLEASRRSPEQSRDLVYLYLATGVGAGIMINGEPYHGGHGMAGEVGHLAVEEEGSRCSCGNIGCLETVISGASILQRFRRRLDEGVISSLQEHRDHLSLEVVRQAAEAGDRLAATTLFELGALLGDAVSKIIKLYNPRTLVIGGPVAVLADHLRESMWLKVRQKVIPEMLVDLSVQVAPSQPRDEALGVAYLAERKFWKEGDERSLSAP